MNRCYIYWSQQMTDHEFRWANVTSPAHTRVFTPVKTLCKLV